MIISVMMLLISYISDDATDDRYQPIKLIKGFLNIQQELPLLFLLDASFLGDHVEDLISGQLVVRY